MSEPRHLPDLMTSANSPMAISDNDCLNINNINCSSMASDNQTLLHLPAEVQHNIYSFVDPQDLGNMALVCKTLYDFIVRDPMLHKDIALRYLDGPNEWNAAAYSELDFKDHLQTSTKLGKILESGQDLLYKSKFIEFVAQVTTRLLKLASSGPESRNIEFLNAHLEHPQNHKDKDNIDTFLCSSATFERAQAAIVPITDDEVHTYEERQASAKMHVQYGVAQSLPRRGKYRDAYGFAASMVYDLRNFTRANFWGPYRNTSDAAVDWEKLEALMIVISHNMDNYRRHTNHMVWPHGQRPFLGATPNSFVHRPIPPPIWVPDPLQDLHSLSRDGVDPYNVTGTWLRVVCFLDFQDLFMYNFAVGLVPVGVPRPELRTTEAVRIIKMEIYATEISRPDPQDGQGFPVVNFEGISRSLHDRGDPNANSNIRGTVRMTHEGEVRWSTISVYGGEERWKSEGIQIGGINSGRGIMGYWFDKDHTVHGPVGPTMFWKQSNDIRARTASPSSDEADSDYQEEEDEEEDGVEDANVVEPEEVIQ